MGDGYDYTNLGYIFRFQKVEILGLIDHPFPFCILFLILLEEIDYLPKILKECFLAKILSTMYGKKRPISQTEPLMCTLRGCEKNG